MPSIYDAVAAAARRAENAQNVGQPESLWPARDAGKPMSASGDLLDLSDEGKQSFEAAKDSKISIQSDDSTKNAEKSLQSSSLKANELTPEDQQKVAELKARDAEVRTHEAAHLAAAGQFATSGASYTYETGPDGKKYAVGGEVSISTSPEDDPQATLEKAQTIQRAALAPAQPSDQDRKVAAAAAQMAAQARQEIAQQKTAELQEPTDTTEQSGSAFQLIREADSDSTAAQPALSPAASYAAQSRMSSNVGQFSVYA